MKAKYNEGTSDKDENAVHLFKYLPDIHFITCHKCSMTNIEWPKGKEEASLKVKEKYRRDCIQSERV